MGKLATAQVLTPFSIRFRAASKMLRLSSTLNPSLAIRSTISSARANILSTCSLWIGLLLNPLTSHIFFSADAFVSAIYVIA